MKFHVRLGPLILCFLLLLSLAAPAMADGQPVYYAMDEPPSQDIYLLPGAPMEDILYELNFGGEWLYPVDGPAEDALYFDIEWPGCAQQYEEAVAAGLKEFIFTGAFVPEADWEPEALERWQAGLIQIAAGQNPTATIHIRPDDLVTVYSAEDDTKSIAVEPGALFDELDLPEESMLFQKGSPYDRYILHAGVTWSREEYEAGMASGAEAFVVTGQYSSCLQEELRPLWEAGLIRAEGQPRLLFYLAELPGEPIVYEEYEMRGNPLAYTYSVTTPPGAAFAEQGVDGLETVLTQRGTEGQSRGRAFRIVWNEEEFAAAMAAGEADFTVHGAFAPGGWPSYELGWWEQGLIRVAEDTPAPALRFRVVQPDEKLPFSVELANRNNGLTPKFTFPTLNGATRVVCAFSLDGVHWFEEEVEPCFVIGDDEVVFYLIASDGEGGFAHATMDSPSYYKITVEGSAYPGESNILVLNADGPLPDDSQDGGTGDGGDDDQGGDRGGGGQGEHDRPGKVMENVDQGVPPTAAQESPPITAQPGEEEQTEQPGPRLPDRPEEGPVEPQPPAAKEEAAAASGAVGGHSQAPIERGALKSIPKEAADAGEGVDPAEEAAPAGPPLRSPQPEATAEAPQTATEPEQKPEAKPIPGFAIATGATAALILGGAGGAFLWRRRK